MGWLKWEKGLESKPETLAIAGTTGLDRFAVAGRLMVVWAWADEVSKTGRINGDVRAFVDELVSRAGFADAMISAGWLSVTDGTTTFPNFRRHNLQTAKERALAAARSARHRERKRHGASVTNHASTRPDPTEPDRTRSNPGKRTTENTGTGSGAGAVDFLGRLPGPHRAESAFDCSDDDRRWLQISCLHIAEALELRGDEVLRQRRALVSICKALMPRADRTDLVRRLIEWATEIRKDPSVDCVARCWQSRVNDLFVRLGIREARVKRAS